jgi:hypothetical protein
MQISAFGSVFQGIRIAISGHSDQFAVNYQDGFRTAAG